MIKSLGMAVVAVFLFSPIFAMADIIGTATLEVHWSYPDYHYGYYLDYDGYLTIDGDRSWVEMFCVEDADAPRQNELYTLLSIDQSLDDHFGLSSSVFRQAAWIADEYGYSSDDSKAEAQKAIWQITGVMNIVGDSGLDYDILNTYLPNDLSAYDASGWALAVSPQVSMNDSVDLANFQNYLVPNGAPVPEPATMLLLGTGLIGLAGLGRKRLKKSA